LFDTPQGTVRKQGRLMRLREETALRRKGSGTGDQGSGKTPRTIREGKVRGTERSFASLRMTAGRTRYVLTFKGPVRQERAQGNEAVGKRRYESLTSVRPAARAERDVSYKGGGQAGKPVLRNAAESRRYKVREEAEYIVENPRAIWAVVGPAGMRPSFRYEKFRTSYSVPRASGSMTTTLCSRRRPRPAPRTLGGRVQWPEAGLLTSPGRGPSEGEELLRWMGEHVDGWQT